MFQTSENLDSSIKSETITHPTVSVLKTDPENIISDIGSAMRTAGYKDVISPNLETLLKVNISWQHYYPACSTSPWQLDGVIQTLKDDGFQNIIPTHNGTVVVDAKEGARNNKHTHVEHIHELDSVFLEDEEWIPFQPSEKMLVLDEIFSEGIIAIHSVFKLALLGSRLNVPITDIFLSTTMVLACKPKIGLCSKVS